LIADAVGGCRTGAKDSGQAGRYPHGAAFYCHCSERGVSVRWTHLSHFQCTRVCQMGGI